jgi:hypothetical protein
MTDTKYKSPGSDSEDCFLLRIMVVTVLDTSHTNVVS